MASPSSPWSDAEIEATVDDYFEMFAAEAAGKKYSKTEHRQKLLKKLDSGRTEQAIEFKHANISAVMDELGLPYIPGYKPRRNYQAELRTVIVRRLEDPELLERLRLTSMARANSRAEASAPQSSVSNFGPNEWLVDEIYQRYRADPNAVDKAWWSFFADYQPPAANHGNLTATDLVDRAASLRASAPAPEIRAAVLNEALAALDEAIRLEPSRPDARALREDLLKDLGGDPEGSITDGFEDVPAVGDYAVEADAVELLAGGYDPDDAENPNREDALGFNDDVNMLCSVVAAKTARPPLSLGLFGEWGSGKSFFMRLMRQRVEKLAAAAYEAEDGGRETRYCSHVVQINFNAWHYMDTNLWASLAVEIFNRLSTPPRPGVAPPTDAEAERARVEEERARVLRRLDTYQRQVTELADTHKRAERERERVEKELVETTKRRETTARRLAAVAAENVTRELDKDPELQVLRARTAQTLGMSELPSPELPELVGDLRKLSGQVGGIWRLLAKRSATWMFWLTTVFAVALLVGLVLLATPGRLVPGAASIAVALAAISGFAARVRPVLAAVSSGLDMAELALRRADMLEQQFRERQTKEQIELEAKLKGLAVQEESLAVQLGEASAKEAEARAEEEELRAGRRLHRFLEERSSSDDYRSHLGVISRLHQDLQQLSTLLELTEDDRNQRVESDSLPRIDRIILYVDDLDRCPPASVVEVLQAIHLLLALPLFVVVVGVDPRWLLRSLQRHYRALLTAPTGERPQDADISHWASTPQNYLEKIFQVPFALMPMTNTGFARLVDGLTGRGEDFQVPADGHTQDEGEPKNVQGRELALTPLPDTEGLPILMEKGSMVNLGERIDPNPAGLTITDQEIRFIQALAPLVPTPRAGKRLVNIYRMIRSTQAVGRTSTFMDTGTDSDGDYRAILQLLAIVSGFPQLAMAVFSMLLQADPGQSWSAFLDTFAEVESRSHYRSSRRHNNSQASDWSRLRAGLLTVRHNVSVPEDLRAYRQWAPQAARFSFFAGCQLLELPEL